MQYFHIFNASPHIDKYMLSSVIMLLQQEIIVHHVIQCSLSSYFPLGHVAS